MIAKAKSISHGHGDLSYITGESVNKKHPERILRLYDNLMPSSLNATGMWDSFKLAMSRSKSRFKNDAIRMEISPAMEHTKDYTIDDWRQLLFDFLTTADSLELKDKHGKVFSEMTNLMNSKFTAWLHFESDSGIPHIHVAALRIDKDGRTNNDHSIDVRARKAAELVAQKRGWTTAREIRMTNISKLQTQCEQVLKGMQTFSYDAYFDALRALEEGYDVEAKYDNNGILRRYTVYDGHKKYKASDIGKGRHYTISQLKHTWEKLHLELAQTENRPVADLQGKNSNSASVLQQECKGGAAPVQSPCTDSAKDLQQIKKPQTAMPNANFYLIRRPKSVPYDYEHDGKTTRFYLPETVMDYFNDEFDWRFVSNINDLIRLSVEAFVGIAVGPTEYTSVDTGGGASQSDLPWRDKDDDDLMWAKRCAKYATAKLGKKPKVKRSM